MKVLHVSSSDSGGGAGRAAYRIHQAVKEAGGSSFMRVIKKESIDQDVSDWFPKSFVKQLESHFYRRWLFKLKDKWSSAINELHTFGSYGVGLVDELNNSDADIIHLHWVSDMLSIADIGKIKKPIVWTMHDMWPFCGSEHYALDEPEARFKVGYSLSNRPKGEKGRDLSRVTWEAKRKAWAGQSFHIVSTSKWMDQCVHSSYLFGNSSREVIPLPIDSQFRWKPQSKEIARTALNLPPNKKLVLMGADGSVLHPRKGGDLLLEAIGNLNNTNLYDIELVIFGKTFPMDFELYSFPIHYLGPIKDDRLLALAYSAADVLVTPSRQEAFGLTAQEALACGTPVVAFDIGGLSDLLVHQENGWLATPFDPSDLAKGIDWILEDSTRYIELSKRARMRIEENYSPEIIGKKHFQLYEGILGNRSITDHL
ncbi:glycosyltransferase [Algoriphagus aquatilis]|uniref:Glycosyltransferase n=1 Tax=Algoriphagus aquatilis TaxID=490186 RepID=A0ABW0BSP6_9BACT